MPLYRCQGILGARRIKAAKAVWMQMTENPVVGGESLLIESKKPYNDLHTVSVKFGKARAVPLVQKARSQH